MMHHLPNRDKKRACEKKSRTNYCIHILSEVYSHSTFAFDMARNDPTNHICVR